MKHLMFDHVCVLRKCLLAHGTFVWFKSSVKQLMFEHVCLLGKTFFANRTLEGFQSIVNEIMSLEVG